LAGITGDIRGRGMKRVIFFCKDKCSGCSNLKRYLDSKGIIYEEIHGDSAEGITYMRINGIFLGYFPALCVGNRLYQYADLFDSKGHILDLEVILRG
jgi:hypothetical protein